MGFGMSRDGTKFSVIDFSGNIWISTDSAATWTIPAMTGLYQVMQDLGFFNQLTLVPILLSLIVLTQY